MHHGRCNKKYILGIILAVGLNPTIVCSLIVMHVQVDKGRIHPWDLLHVLLALNNHSYPHRMNTKRLYLHMHGWLNI